MYRRILVPTDGSALSRKAIAHAVALARLDRATIIGLHVRLPESYVYYGDGAFVLPANTTRQLQQQAIQAARRYLAQIETAARKAKVRCKLVQVESPSPSAAIVKTARKEKCGLIVMASHGRKGVSRLLLGSETSQVLTHTRVPVLVTR
jgi:nucleotide-binding universal stress UspA family protein